MFKKLTSLINSNNSSYKIGVSIGPTYYSDQRRPYLSITLILEKDNNPLEEFTYNIGRILNVEYNKGIFGKSNILDDLIILSLILNGNSDLIEDLYEIDHKTVKIKIEEVLKDHTEIKEFKLEKEIKEEKIQGISVYSGWIIFDNTYKELLYTIFRNGLETSKGKVDKKSIKEYVMRNFVLKKVLQDLLSNGSVVKVIAKRLYEISMSKKGVWTETYGDLEFRTAYAIALGIYHGFIDIDDKKIWDSIVGKRAEEYSGLLYALQKVEDNINLLNGYLNVLGRNLSEEETNEIERKLSKWMEKSEKLKEIIKRYKDIPKIKEKVLKISDFKNPLDKLLSENREEAILASVAFQMVRAKKWVDLYWKLIDLIEGRKSSL